MKPDRYCSPKLHFSLKVKSNLQMPVVVAQATRNGLWRHGTSAGKAVDILQKSTFHTDLDRSPRSFVNFTDDRIPYCGTERPVAVR